MRRTTLLAGTVVAAAAVVALSACNSNVSGSPQPTSAQGSGNGGGSIGAQVSTVSDLANVIGQKTTSGETSHISMQMTMGQLGNLSGTGQVKYGNPVAEELSMQMPGGMGTMKMVLLDDVFYMNMPQLSQAVGKPWVKIDANGTDPMSKQFGQLISSADQNADPTKMLDKIKDAGTINSKSTDTVDGQQTTKYSITVDVAKEAQVLGDNDTMKQMISAAQRAGLKSYPLNVWLNSDNLPVKMTTDLKLTVNGQSMDENVAVSFTDWGQPVNIQAPPAAEVGTMPTNG